MTLTIIDVYKLILNIFVYWKVPTLEEKIAMCSFLTDCRISTIPIFPDYLDKCLGID